ncbi:unnamed protein product [Caenorhabditis nigoni]
MTEISKSTSIIEDETSDILSKKVLVKLKNWNNEDCLVLVLLLFLISYGIECFFSLFDLYSSIFGDVKLPKNDNYTGFVFLFFEAYNLISAVTTVVIMHHIAQRFLKLWACLAICNIFIGFACIFHLYKVFTTDPNAEKYFYAFKYMLLSMPIWFPIYILANGFGALVLWKISNMKRGYYGDDIYLVIYGGEESSTKKM